MTSKRPLIAIVDDEESVRRALTRLFVSAGMGVESFATGAEFFEAIKIHRPDCVVLDLHMPGLNGFDIHARLVRGADRLPVVVITGHDSLESRRRLLDAGGTGYLRKPVDGQVLLEAVAAAIG